jgi:hypothetical protein
MKKIFSTLFSFLFVLQLQAQTYETLPYLDSFNSGTLGTEWETTSSDADGQINCLYKCSLRTIRRSRVINYARNL